MKILIDIIGKLDSHVFHAIDHSKSNKKQSNESIIFTPFSEKLDVLNIDKERITESSNWAQ